MSQGNDSLFSREFKRVDADAREAIVFLANIIPEDAKGQIRRQIEEDHEFSGKQHMFLGMKVRNALRAGGFFYSPHTMDLIWFSWLKKAVFLTESEIIMTNSIKERINRYNASVAKPPICPEIEIEEIEKIKGRIEKRHRIKLPVEVRYSDNIDRGFCIAAVDFPPRMPSEEKNRFYRDRNVLLSLKGLKDCELEGIDPSKFTIFLPRRHLNYPAHLYATLSEELGHAAARALFVKDKSLDGSIAVAYRFAGLLEAAKEGKFPLEKAFDQIELDLKNLQHNPLSYFSDHHQSLHTIREYNPYLRFRNRDPDEILVELDKSIDYALSIDKKRKFKFEKYLILGLAIVVAALMIISFLLSFP